MTKTKFYTLENKNGRPTATLKNGYTDGRYNYYYNNVFRRWYAIMPNVGLSICDDRTLRDTMLKVYSDDVQNKVNDYITRDVDRYAGYIERYFDAVKKAEKTRFLEDVKK